MEIYLDGVVIKQEMGPGLLLFCSSAMAKSQQQDDVPELLLLSLLMINDSSFNARGEVKNIQFLFSPDLDQNKEMTKNEQRARS